MPRGHSFHAAAVLLDGRVLIIGGYYANETATDLYRP
jgi:hypothetical protein